MSGSVNKDCAHCGVNFRRPKNTSWVRWEKRLYCSKRCAGKNTPVVTGPDHPLWRGGKTVTAQGYIAYTNSPHNREFAGMTVHRAVAQAGADYELCSKDHVHHRDGNKRNNDAKNLLVLSASEHAKYHAIKSGLGRHSRA